MPELDPPTYRLAVAQFNEAAEAMARVADGDLSLQAREERGDEVGRLFGSLSRRLNQSDERIMALGGRFGAARLAVFMLRLAADSGQVRPDGGQVRTAGEPLPPPQPP